MADLFFVTAVFGDRLVFLVLFNNSLVLIENDRLIFRDRLVSGRLVRADLLGQTFW